jgi:hypothetical protein
MATESKILCPSSTCKEGAILLGIVLPNGKVAVSSTEYIVDAEFVEEAKSGRLPEERFRFAGKCASSGCGNWKEHKCSVIELVKDDIDQTVGKSPGASPLPDCAIRTSCRWYSQRGPEACYYCEFVVRGVE